jgi:hypothetical protein
MDNVNQPPGQDPQEHRPTQPFRFTPGWPGSAAGYSQPPPGQRGYPAQPEYPGQPDQPQPGSPYAQPEDQYTQPGPYAQPGSQYAQPGSPNIQSGGYPPPGGPYTPPGGLFPPPGSPSRQRGKQRRKRLRWTAGITAAVLLAAGGAVAGLKLAGNSPVPANAANATALNNELSAAASSTSCQGASGTSPSSQPSQSSQSGKLRCHWHHLHLLRLVRGMYGEVAFHTPHGTETLAFERGVIESASGGSVVVRARNGTTWTWTLVSNSVIRKNRRTATSSALSKGDLVFVGGQVTGSARGARLIMVRRASSSGSSSRSSSSTAPSA